MGRSNLVHFICLFCLVNYSYVLATEAISECSLSGVAAASTVAAEAATAAVTGEKVACDAAAADVAGRHAAGVGISRARDVANQKILAEGARKAANDLLVGTNAAVSIVQTSSDANEAAINTAVARLAAIIHNTGDALEVDTAIDNTKLIDVVKATAGKVLADLSATIAGTQALVHEQVVGIDSIVGSAVAGILKNIQDATCIIASSTHAALQATKNNVITASRAVSADTAAARRNVDKDVIAADVNSQRSLLFGGGTLQKSAGILARSRG